LHIESLFISQLRQSRSKLIKSFQLGNMGKDQLAVFRSIYRAGGDRAEKDCSGRETRAFVEALETEREGASKKTAALLENYRKELGKHSTKIVKLQE
jgi:hypothetical protein